MDLPEVFSGLSPRRVQEAMQHFRMVDVEAGVRIIEPGDEDATLVVIAQGDLQIETASGALIGRAGAGDIVGAMAFYGDGIRKLGVWTRGPSRLLVIEREAYTALRDASHPVVHALEDRALACLESRFAHVCTTIGQHGQDGEPLTDHGANDSLVGRFFSMFGGRPSPTRIAAALAAHGNFRGAAPETLEKLGKHFEAVPARPGDLLLARGDIPAHVCFIAHGAAEMIAVTGPRHGYGMGVLGPGEGFGLSAGVAITDPSGVTVVARERSTLLTLDRLRWAELANQLDDVGGALRAAAIRASATQLWRASVLLAGLVSTR